MYKNKHVLIRKLNTFSNEKKYYHHPTFIQYKKSLINLFKNITQEKRKKFKREKIKIKI
jgi:hypothetical protein